MISNDADFARYSSDFYTSSNRLPPQSPLPNRRTPQKRRTPLFCLLRLPLPRYSSRATLTTLSTRVACVTDLSFAQKERVIKSTERLRSFANDSGACRWVGLLGLMGERSPFARCGTCDTCLNAKKHAGDNERDFGAVARLMLTVVQSNAIWTQMNAALGATSPAGARVAPSSIEGLRAALKPKRSVPALREFLPLLVQAGLLQRSTKTGSYAACVLASPLLRPTPQSLQVATLTPSPISSSPSPL